MRCAMKLVAFFAVPCLASRHAPAEGSVHEHPGANAVHLHQHHGFADADLNADESYRFLRHEAEVADKSHFRGNGVPVPRQPIKEPMVPEKVQREVEQMLRRVERLDDAALTREFAEELGDVETALSVNASVQDSHLLTEISKVRADLCVKQGFASHESDKCELFMRQACSGAKTALLQLAPGTPPAACNQFFLLRSASHAGAAPASAPAAAPGPGPAPGLFGTKLGRPMPSQGFTGEDVEHGDMQTFTGDWRHEFGPKSGHKSFREICADHPNNEWCRLHGYYESERPHKSGASRIQVMTLLMSVIAGGALAAW